MTETQPPIAHTADQHIQHPHNFYEIRIEGHLDSKWRARFIGLTFLLEESGNTLLAGPVVDQAALHGLLRKVRDLGMPLISVTRITPGHPHA